MYKFLDYFSKFDWDNYCISLNGPVQISSLPEIIGEQQFMHFFNTVGSFSLVGTPMPLHFSSLVVLIFLTLSLSLSSLHFLFFFLCAAETPENGGADLLLSADFLRHCVDMFSVPSRGIETNSRIFMQKHLNIIDPLKENNNLGRSVSKG